VLSGRLTGSAFGVYVWLHLQADHRTGTLRTNAGRLAGELGMHAAKVRRDLAALRACRYIRYASEPGCRELYVITIEKYDCHFERPEAGAEPVAVHVEGHVAGHVAGQERRASARGVSENRAPKNMEVRSKNKPKKKLTSTASLRVRSADADPVEQRFLQALEAPSEQERSRADALAQAPAILRETLELFFLKRPGAPGWARMNVPRCATLSARTRPR
jgi:hypothetical protein